MAKATIPTVDLSPFVGGGEDDKDAKKKVMELIGRACSEHGFFQIVNHEEKLKCRRFSGAPIPIGYFNNPEHSCDKNEHFLVLSPDPGFNIYPNNPPQLKQVLGKIFPYFTNLIKVVEAIICECLGLPPHFLEEYNDNSSMNFLLALHYFPATETENLGKCAHEDGNCITFVFQDEVGGLEVHQDRQWIAITPLEGTIIVNVGDLIQIKGVFFFFCQKKVLSNNEFKSATHRVGRQRGRSRYSYAFFYNLDGDKRVEPLPKFTKDIGEPPNYRGFMYEEYFQLRLRNRTHPPSRPEDLIHITHYAIPSNATT
ncbi:Flavanone 3-dioxygenase [Bertholletia excelsa]